MENSIYTPSNFHQEKNLGIKNVSMGLLKFLGILILVFPLIIISFYIGRQSVPSEKISESLLETNTPTPIIDKPSPTQGKPSATPSAKLKPTPKNTPTPIAESIIITSDKNLDGYRSSNAEGNQNLEIRVGRNDELVSRGFVSFLLNDLPSGVKIVEVTLRLYQTKVIGNPFAEGGSIKVDHLTFGDSLDASDYGLAALTTNAATLSNSKNIGWKEALVTQLTRNDIENGRSVSQFRIHFNVENTDKNSTGDFVYFESRENNQGTGYVPQLVVKYY